jgi:protein SCO1/2
MRYLVIIFLAFSLVSCHQDREPLPFLGNKEVVNGTEVPHTIREFNLYNQDSIEVNNQVLSDYIYVADYFFTSCPSICPIVKKQILRIHDKYKNEPLLKMVSISMDTKRDSIPRLKSYSEKLGVDQDRWWFLTGDKDVIFNLNEDFFIVAYEDAEVPGGFDHSGKIVLVDQEGRVRAFAEGTDEDDVTDFFDDIDNLLEEVKSKSE